ncbi:golgin subfamily A member 7 isoform X1 [Phalacrocorax carbo]|uniref:golgin subfamily A member 7 isoform X1 n=1 Tax=Phalacrocorax carbo TaxID=9209 RepID=UPI003119CA3E
MRRSYRSASHRGGAPVHCRSLRVGEAAARAPGDTSALLPGRSHPDAFATAIDRQQFEETVRTLNNLYAEAEKLGGQSYLEGCLACLTAYTIFLCMETHYEKVLKKIAKFIQEQNEKIYAPQGLLLTDPIERGLRVIEITIYEDRGMTSGR